MVRDKDRGVGIGVGPQTTWCWIGYLTQTPPSAGKSSRI